MAAMPNQNKSWIGFEGPQLHSAIPDESSECIRPAVKVCMFSSHCCSEKGPLESNNSDATRGPHRLVGLGILQQILDVGYTDVVPLGKNPLVPSGD
jgi:hypothetical protein